MHPLKASLAIILLLGGTTLATAPAQAALSESCQQYRQSIIDMEKKIPSGAALYVDLALRGLYTKDCLVHPEGGNDPGSAATDPWFNVKGEPASGPAPEGDGLYQTTSRINDYCRKTWNPQLCALLTNLGEAEIKNAEGQRIDPWRDIDPADLLPPLDIYVAGRPYSIEGHCLAELVPLLFPGAAQPHARSSSCQASIARIKPHLAALKGEITGWRLAALTEPTVRNGQPAFLEMCDEAWRNENTCRQRQANMTTAGTAPDPEAPSSALGQVGAFGDCAALYDSVVKMCKQTGWRPDAAPAFAGISAQCRALAQNYVSAAQANDGPGAQQGLEQLKASCPEVLAMVQPQQAPASPFPSRQMGTALQQTFGACANASDGCASVADGLAQGTSGPAIAGMYGNAIGIGLALGGLMAQGVGTAASLHATVPTYKQPNMNSLAPAPVHSTYGQGAPTFKPAPPSSQSTITGLGQ